MLAILFLCYRETYYFFARFENLVFAIFDFVHALVETPKFRLAVKSGLSDIMYYIVLYMQITHEQVIISQNELKRGKKSILAGQYTVCLKGYNQPFLKFFEGRVPKGDTE